MRHQKFSPRADYRQLENQRIKESISLADKFPKLKSLTVELNFLTPEGVARNSQIKYTVNLDNARSVFRFDCPNGECVGGDFDLSAKLAAAVAAREKVVAGEMCCQGWMSKTTIDRIHCHNILRYTLSLKH